MPVDAYNKDSYLFFTSDDCFAELMMSIKNINKYRKLTIHNSHDSDDDFRSGCRNVGQCHQQQPFSGLLSPGRSNHTNKFPRVVHISA